MTLKLTVKFKDVEELHIEFLDLPFIKDFLKLCHRNYLYQQPIVRDFGTVDFDRMIELANICRELLGWDWILTKDQYLDESITTILHKDLENFLANGYHSIPDGYDQLLHDLHHSLHSMQGKNQRNSIQLEWFNDDGFPMEDFDFINDQTMGSVQLQNPYVGHPPLWVWRQNDYTDVWKTCKFHDFVRPGIVIQTRGTLERNVQQFTSAQQESYLSWWKNHARDFYEHHGEQKLLRNFGHPVIGYVVNNEAVVKLNQRLCVEFEYMLFDTQLAIEETFDETVAIKRSITEKDYHRMAGPSWPAYNEFMMAKDIPKHLLEEIKRMIAR